MVFVIKGCLFLKSGFLTVWAFDGSGVWMQVLSNWIRLLGKDEFAGSDCHRESCFLTAVATDIIS